MNVYTIVLERIGTREPSLSLVPAKTTRRPRVRTRRRQLRNHRTCGSGKFMRAPPL